MHYHTAPKPAAVEEILSFSHKPKRSWWKSHCNWPLFGGLILQTTNTKSAPSTLTIIPDVKYEIRHRIRPVRFERKLEIDVQKVSNKNTISCFYSMEIIYTHARTHTHKLIVFDLHITFYRHIVSISN